MAYDKRIALFTYKVALIVNRFAIHCVFVILLSGTWADSLAADQPFVVVLGIAQDAGYPQAGCQRECCRAAWKEPAHRRMPVCLAIVDPQSRQRWLVECTPQFPAQLRRLDQLFPVDASPGLDGILLTHAHIGHYAGLVHLGREVMGANGVPVFVMPRMRQFLSANGPWDQLVSLKNISLQNLESGRPRQLNPRLSVTPLTVPHRDEYSETVAFKIQGPNRSVLFLPDIDKWTRWETRIEKVIEQVHVAYLDATFFDGEELPGRDISLIPHPFVVESIARFRTLPDDQRSKIRFIHLNHTNPALRPDSRATAQVREAGMRIAQPLEKVLL